MINKYPAVIGIPRAMLYYRCRVLWQTFFQEQGTALAIDEACLSLKIYLGHAAALADRCDCILVPRVSNFGWHRNMCTRFEAMPDLVRNVFRDRQVQVLSYDVDVLLKKDEEDAFVDMGLRLGRSGREAKRAYKLAKKAEAVHRRAVVQKQEALCRQKGMKILIAAHSYVAEDPCLGRTVTDYLKKAGVVPLRADLTDREAAVKRSRELSPTCKWELNREILGGILLREEDADGLILLRAARRGWKPGWRASSTSSDSRRARCNG